MSPPSGTLAPRPATARPAVRFQPEPEIAEAPSPRRHGRVRAVLVGLALAAVVGVFVARCVAVAREDSITSDEATYLAHALHFWMTGDDLTMWDLGSPRLPHLLGALASLEATRAASLLPAPGPDGLEAALNRLLLSGARRAFVPARFVAIGWGVVLLLSVFWATARARGAAIGLVAAGLVSLVPEVLAHSSIASSDMPFTAAAFLAIVLLARYAERPTVGRWVAATLAIGLAWAMRHTALLLLPLAGLVHLVAGVRAHRPQGATAWVECLFRSLWAGAGLAMLAFAVLWAGDGLGTVTVGELSERVTMLRVPSRVGGIDLSRLPLPTSLLSTLKQVRHQNQGHEAYFLGERGTTGWPLYFPVAFLLKTPVGFLGLMVLAAARVRPRGAFDLVALGFLGLLWVMLIRNKVDIGVRYALLTYPLAAVLLARLFEPRPLRDAVWGPLTIGLAVWLGCASLGAEGRFLSSFNEIGGGPRWGWLYLADSNVDWGQDFDRLSRRVGELGLTEITTDVTSERRLELPGVDVYVNPAKILQVPRETPPDRRLYDREGGYIPVFTRYVAVSTSRLMGLYSQNDMSWLRSRKVVSRVGDSIYVFDMNTPATESFAP